MTVELDDVATGHSKTQTVCHNCGSYVTKQFARVFGDNGDQVYGCLECSTMRELRDGSGVDGGA